MMNMLDLQDKLKNLSEDQLVGQMQTPSGEVPQFLVLGEIDRRKRMRNDAQRQQGTTQSTVAQDVVTAAGVPQAGIAGMAQAMAPQTDMSQNTGIMSTAQAPEAPQGMSTAPQMMAGGGLVKMAEGGRVQSGPAFNDPVVIAMANREGMDVETYLNSLPPAQSKALQEGSAARAARGTTTRLENVFDPARSVSDQTGLQDGLTFEQRKLDALAALGVNPTVALGGQPSIAPEAPLPTAAEVYAQDNPPAVAARPMPDSLSFGETFGPMAAAAPGAMYNSLKTNLFNVPPEDRMSTQILRAQEKSAAGPIGIESLAYMYPGSEFAGNGPDIATGFRAREKSAAGPTVPAGIDTLTGAVDEFSGVNTDTPTSRSLARSLLDPLGFGPALEKAGIQEYAPVAPSTALAQEKSAAGPSIPKTPEEQAAAAEAERLAVEKKVADATAAATAAVKSGGLGAGKSSQSDYEKMLMETLANREKARNQDKWLALAEVGLGMMASQSPTLAGAVGEAGLKGAESYKKSRDQYDTDRMSILGELEKYRQARAAAQAAASKAAAPKAIPAALLKIFLEEQAAAKAALAGIPDKPKAGWFGTPVDENEIARLDAANQAKYWEALAAAGLGSYGIGTAPTAGTPGVPNLSD